MSTPAHLDRLNPAQRRAVEYGLTGNGSSPPLLIIAGAGTGKTTTLAHRVAECVLRGTDPARLLLLTFTRRAAREMTRRAERIVAQVARSGSGRRRAGSGSLRWAGTFHAIAHRCACTPRRCRWSRRSPCSTAPTPRTCST
jgi:DNA helicase-2/ATP-dependent DNA helicase PcrA